MVSLKYVGSGKRNILGVGYNKINVVNGDILSDVPKQVFEDLKNREDFKVLKEKPSSNKMEKSTKGSE